MHRPCGKLVAVTVLSVIPLAGGSEGIEDLPGEEQPSLVISGGVSPEGGDTNLPRTSPGANQMSEWPSLEWSEMPRLPASAGDGFSGSYVGAHNGALLVCGGTRFPGAPPWEGGEREWSDAIYLLWRGYTEEDQPEWRVLEESMPKPMAFGAAVETQDGLVCIGGNVAGVPTRAVLCLSWNPILEKLEIRSLPPLPYPLAMASAARLGDTIYVAGGQQETPAGKPLDVFLSLDLSLLNDSGGGATWVSLPSWPGRPRLMATLVAVPGDEGADERGVYLFGGKDVAEDGTTTILGDAHRFDPSLGEWERLPDMMIDGMGRKALVGAPGVAIGDGRILLLGGDDGTLSLIYDLLASRILETEAEQEAYRALSVAILEGHPGYSRDVIAFDLEGKTYTHVGSLPAAARVGTRAVWWRRQIVLPGGEISPGRRTAEVLNLVGLDPPIDDFGVRWSPLPENLVIDPVTGEQILRAIPAEIYGGSQAPSRSAVEDLESPGGRILTRGMESEGSTPPDAAERSLPSELLPPSIVRPESFD
jgi:N-acetylneuraminic acid mutarotase